MLIEFTFSNFRSFKDPATLSMVAANITSDPKSVDENNLIHVSDKLDLLTSAAVYGANASGKSNLVKALAFMRNFILDSFRQTQVDEPVPVETFRLNLAAEKQPASFEVIFLIDKQPYRYGFEVTPQRVVREWLYTTPSTREARLFTRDADEIDVNPRTFREGRGLEKRTRPNALFLSVVAQLNGPIAAQVLSWFRRLGIISGLGVVEYQAYTLDKLMSDPQRAQQIKQFVSTLDLDIDDIQVERVQASELTLPKSMPDDLKSLLLKGPGEILVVRTAHKKYDVDQKPLPEKEMFTLEGNESEGTKKLLYLSGPLIDTLLSGRILIIDEMEARMHPIQTQSIIRLFNSLETNPKRSQLIFTTHDSTLLDRNLFRRDQIWFTEKDRFGATHLYSLVEFRLRNDASFAKDYLRGHYGAVPYRGTEIPASVRTFLAGEEKGEYEA